MATTYTRRVYSESDRTRKARKDLEENANQKPGDYDSRWLPRLDQAVEQILSRPDFQYDMYTDPLYHQHRDSYVNQGRMAMADTMGQAAALTGGYGNSQAQVAGQQVYNAQLQELNSLLPQLYQLALEAYDRQGQNLYNRYGVLSDREGLDYSRWGDAYGRWGDERDYLTGRHDAERGFDYAEFRDTVGDDQWQAAFDEDIRRFDFANKLGEFAPVPSSAPSDSSGTPRKKKKEEDEEEEKKNKAASHAGFHPNPTYGDRTNPSRYSASAY